MTLNSLPYLLFYTDIPHKVSYSIISLFYENIRP